MTVTTNERGQQNMWAIEPPVYISDEDAKKYGMKTYAERAESTNGRWAMLGIVAGFISYALTGHLFFGIIWGLTMTSIIFTMTSVAFLVLLAHSVNQLSETY